MDFHVLGSVSKHVFSAARFGPELFHSSFPRPFEASFKFPDEEGEMSTSHRVDGLAFLNDDVVGEYKDDSLRCKDMKTVHKKSVTSVWKDDVEEVNGV